MLLLLLEPVIAADLGTGEGLDEWGGMLRASCSTALDMPWREGLPKFGEFVILFIWASGPPPPDWENIPREGLIAPLEDAMLRGPRLFAAAIIAA